MQDRESAINHLKLTNMSLYLPIIYIVGQAKPVPLRSRLLIHRIPRSKQKLYRPAQPTRPSSSIQMRSFVLMPSPTYTMEKHEMTGKFEK